MRDRTLLALLLADRSSDAPALLEEAIWRVLQWRLLCWIDADAPWREAWEAVRRAPSARAEAALTGAWGLPGRRTPLVPPPAALDALRTLEPAGPEALEDHYQALMGLRLGPEGLEEAGEDRWERGAWYTPEHLAEAVLAGAIDPLLHRADALRVVDPACGGGRLLRGAAARIGAALGGAEHGAARVYGADLDRVAVALTRATLWATGAPRSAPLPHWTEHIAWGHALLGATPARLAGADPETWCRDPLGADAPGAPPLHWHQRFPEVFSPSRGPAHPSEGWPGGFDAVVGNPPWIAHVGRAARPLPPRVRALYTRHDRAFAGYRTTHGLFVHLGARLLRPGGRLALVLPTSVADLDGYAPTRAAHDALCAVPAPLEHYPGHEFEGVFQPCMVLVSQRSAGPCQPPETWPLVCRALDAAGQRLLARLAALPPVAPATFGERGLQTDRRIRAALLCGDGPDAAHPIPLRRGQDIRAFRRLPPGCHGEAQVIGPLLRQERGEVLVRQTARFPVAAVSDGIAFRNSILAGFAVGPWTPHALTAWLNSAPVRWLHFHRYRDAREGMPQVKIKHLRSTPMAPEWLLPELDRIGKEADGVGLSATMQGALDRLVGGAWGLSEAELARVAGWAAGMGGI
ncbi:MAG: hypothetical protein JXX28_15130 [Deltaproteobacteria bacterium]|nr:hypothetical protein [Deltaproteobacteria bacterium]